jgi:hypothetical protein
MRPASITEMVGFAQVSARKKYPEVHKKWLDMCNRLGNGEGGPLLGSAVAFLGDLDTLIRCLEDEFKDFWDTSERRDILPSTVQMYLSELWVAKAFAALYAIRNEASFTEEMKAVYRELRIIRVPLQKFEAAWPDKKVPPSQTMETSGTEAALFSLNHYDSGTDRFKMGFGVSPRGSSNWRVVDRNSRAERWIERRYLSDLMLEKC